MTQSKVKITCVAHCTMLLGEMNCCKCRQAIAAWFNIMLLFAMTDYSCHRMINHIAAKQVLNL